MRSSRNIRIGLGLAALAATAGLAALLLLHDDSDRAQQRPLRPFELEAEFTMIDNSRTVGTSIGGSNSSIPPSEITRSGVLRWNFADSEHFRWELEIFAPPLESNLMVMASDGHSFVVYDQSANTLTRSDHQATPSGNPPVPPTAFIVGPLPHEDLQSLLVEWGQGEEDTRSVRIVGDDVVLGRKTTIVELTDVSGIALDAVNGASSTSTATTRLWLDPERMFGMRVTFEDSSGVVSYLAEVTGLRYDLPADEVSVDFAPPSGAIVIAPDEPGSTGITTNSGSSHVGGRSTSTYVGFLNPTYVPAGWAMNSIGEEHDTTGKIGIETLYQPSTGASDYLRISQRMRADGFPALLVTDTPLRINGHEVYRGPADGTRTLAWEQDGIVVVLASDGLPYEELKRVAAAMVMR